MSSSDATATSLTEPAPDRAKYGRRATAVGLSALIFLVGSWLAPWAGGASHEDIGLLALPAAGVSAMLGGTIAAYTLLFMAKAAPGQWRDVLARAGLAAMVPLTALTCLVPYDATVSRDDVDLHLGIGVLPALLGLAILAVAFAQLLGGDPRQ